MCPVPLAKLKLLILTLYFFSCALRFAMVFSFRSSVELFQTIGPLKATEFLPTSVLTGGILQTVFYTQSKNVQFNKIYGYDTIGSMIGMATLNGLLAYNYTGTKGCTKTLVDPPYREPACVDRIQNSTAVKSKI